MKQTNAQIANNSLTFGSRGVYGNFTALRLLPGVNLRNTRRALHEVVDVLIDAIEADIATGEALAPLPPRKARRAPRYVPPPDPARTTPEMREAMARRI